jgi:hypothetical protein
VETKMTEHPTAEDMANKCEQPGKRVPSQAMGL